MNSENKKCHTGQIIMSQQGKAGEQKKSKSAPSFSRAHILGHRSEKA
jgi:hypothetical protein